VKRRTASGTCRGGKRGTEEEGEESLSVRWGVTPGGKPPQKPEGGEEEEEEEEEVMSRAAVARQETEE